ncbi:MAG: helix-turn-helix domain-containing protein [Dehalococcoidia bacterium]|nr:helix-turn-helix domain-containing protein [Dehalococcoidia bacterium]
MGEYLLSDNEYLLIPDVAKLLKVSKSACYSYAKQGKLPGVLVIGESVRVSRRALEAWLGRAIQDVEL